VGIFKPDVNKMEKRKDVEGLIKALKHRDKNVQKNAIEALGDIGDTRSVKPLIEVLRDEDGKVRKEATMALEKIRAPFIKALKDGDVFIRMNMAESIVKIGELAVEPLIQALKDENVNVQIKAVESLGKIGDKRAVGPLISLLENKDIGGEAAKALGKIGDKRAVEPLIQALRHGRFPEMAAEALGEIGDLRAAEAVIGWLFMECLDMTSIKHKSRLNPFEGALGNLFGDYKDLIIKALTYVQVRNAIDYGNIAHYEYGLYERDDPIRKLCEIPTQISSNILHKVSQKTDVNVELSYSSVHGYKYGTLSFESQRETAKSELKRRGNPPYDSSAYLDENAWKIQPKIW